MKYIYYTWPSLPFNYLKCFFSWNSNLYSYRHATTALAWFRKKEKPLHFFCINIKMASNILKKCNVAICYSGRVTCLRFRGSKQNIKIELQKLPLQCVHGEGNPNYVWAFVTLFATQTDAPYFWTTDKVKVSFLWLFFTWTRQVHCEYEIREWPVLLVVSQLAFTCSKLAIETLEKGVKYVQS